MTANEGTHEDTYDVIVVGSGGGGTVGAYLAAARGLRTALIEKADVVGGTTSYAGAGIWFPGSAPIVRAGLDDTVDAARTYLRSVVDDPSRHDLLDAYLSGGIAVIDELEKSRWFPPFFHAAIPEYYSSAPGFSPVGRTIFPVDLPAEELGDAAELVRPQLYTERWGVEAGPVLLGGRALVGRALGAFLETGNGTLLRNTALESLIVEDGRVVGVETTGDGGPRRLRATRGVILAAGGFEHNAELRARHQGDFLTGEWSNGAPTNTGDALQAAVAVGAATELLDEAWFVPGVVRPDGRPIFHTGTRGGIWVNAAGERFVNETRPYDQAGHELYRLHRTSGVSHLPAHWVFDQRQLDRYSLGGSPDVPPGEEWFTSGALRKADTLEELADVLGVPADALQATVDRFNGFAATGVDLDFHRGETPWDLFSSKIVGYPAGPRRGYPAPPDPELPNPLLEPIGTGPFYAATVLLSDIGTKGGLRIDTSARVLREDGRPIGNLYAIGNTAAAVMGRVYPGAGGPIGTGLAFAYNAVSDLSGAAQPAG